MNQRPPTFNNSTLERVAYYPLLDAFIEHHSRRFGTGVCLNGSPLSISAHCKHTMGVCCDCTGRDATESRTNGSNTGG
jgi:hypothetical protein